MDSVGMHRRVSGGATLAVGSILGVWFVLTGVGSVSILVLPLAALVGLGGLYTP